MDSRELKFPANLPPDSDMPVRPTKDFDPKTGRRRHRIWLDAYLTPGEGDLLLLLGDQNVFDVTLRAVPRDSVKSQ